MRHLFILWLMLTACTGYSLEFDVSPNSSGSADLNVYHSWDYSSYFFSSMELNHESDTYEEKREDLYFVQTTKIYALDIVLFCAKYGFSWQSVFYEYTRLKDGIKGFSGLKLNGSLTQIHSMQYETIVDSFVTLQDRDFRLLLPELYGEVEYFMLDGELSFSAGGELTPWLYVWFSQNLQVNPNFPKQQFQDQGAANLGWSVFFNLRIFAFSTFISYSEVQMPYRYLTQAGIFSSIEPLRNMIMEEKIDLNFINLNGFIPTLALEINASQGRAKTKLKLGFRQEFEREKNKS